MNVDEEYQCPLNVSVSSGPLYHGKIKKRDNESETKKEKKRKGWHCHVGAFIIFIRLCNLGMVPVW